MTRTRLRGLEIGGIQIGIEVPDDFSWEWPETPIADFSCLPRDPDVHVGLRVSALSSQDLGGDRYGVGAWTFEVARDGQNWLLGLSRRGAREQLATFDADFRFGEVLMSREIAEGHIFPLRTPLDEWIVLHRNVLRGGLCLSGQAEPIGLHAAVHLGAAVSVCESESRVRHNRWFTPKSALFGRETVLVREDRGGLRSYRTPWNPRTDSSLGYSTRVEKFVVTEASGNDYRECVDPTEAAEWLLSHSVVPLCDDVFFEHAMCNARKMSERTPFIRVGQSWVDSDELPARAIPPLADFGSPRSRA